MSDVNEMRKLIEALEKEGANPVLCYALDESLNAIAGDLTRARDRCAQLQFERDGLMVELNSWRCPGQGKAEPAG